MKHKQIRIGNLLEMHRREISRCVRCGACSAVCPTFLKERRESQSPRGRMALIEAVLEGRLAVSGIFKDRLAACAGCLACEASCPGGVPVTEIITAAKEQAIAESGAGIINTVIGGVLRHPAAFRATAWLAPAVLHYSKGRGAKAEGRRSRRALSRDIQWQARCGVRNEKEQGHRAKGRVVFFPGCVVAGFQQDIGRSATAVLCRLGYEVIVPENLKCCGRPLLSLGDRRAAEEQAEHNTALFETVKADAIVTACASCGLTFKKEYPKLLRSGKKAPSVLDIHEFLAGESGLGTLRTVRKRVTWHDPCHLGRGQGLSGRARDLLRCVPGIELVEMNDPDRCCGFGGVMRITHPAISDGIAEDKARNIIATRAKAVVTGCPGCRMQIAHALDLVGSDIEVLHTVQVLEEALANAGFGCPEATSMLQENHEGRPEFTR